MTLAMTITKTTHALLASIAALAFTAPALAQGEAAPVSEADQTETETDMYVRMTTNKGDIVLQLDAENAPISTENFVQYVEDEHYNGLVFHRVIPNFMIQGGGFTADGEKADTRAPIKNEWQNGLKNERGTIAMARTQVADSATSQFFINVVDNGFLDQPRDGAAYAVFGKVVQGMDVVDEIRKVRTGIRSGMRDWPVEPVVIEKATVMTDEEVAAMGDEGDDADTDSEG